MDIEPRVRGLLIRSYAVLASEFARQVESGDQTDEEVFRSEKHEEIDLRAIEDLAAMQSLLNDILAVIPAAGEAANSGLTG